MPSRLVPVTFRYPSPTPGPVALLGSFNHWDSRVHPLRLTDGEWRITIYLPPGTYPYAFLVEGQRTHDPGSSDALHGGPGYSIATVTEPRLARSA